MSKVVSRVTFGLFLVDQLSIVRVFSVDMTVPQIRGTVRGGQVFAAAFRGILTPIQFLRAQFLYLGREVDPNT